MGSRWLIALVSIQTCMKKIKQLSFEFNNAKFFVGESYPSEEISTVGSKLDKSEK